MEQVKIFENFLGRPIEASGPSSPVIVTGLSAVPAAGEPFSAFADKKSAEEFVAALPLPAENPAPTRAQRQSPTPELPDAAAKPVFNIIIKADAQGSREALESEIKKLENERVSIKVLKSEIGDINESDVKMALATRLVTIAGFRVKIDPSVREMARHANIHIITGEVIYELLDQTAQEINSLVPPEKKRVILGRLKILKFFKKENGGQIVGGRVEEGIVRKGATAEIIRAGEPVDTGAIIQLQREKNPAPEVGAGAECGLLVNAKTTIQPGDILVVFQEE